MSTRRIVHGDSEYPSALPNRAFCPVDLFVRGTLPARPGLAIVGTRQASAEAIRFTEELAAALATEGYAIWSGGALGIDAAAHRGALDAGGPTIVVAGRGLDEAYPREHASLFERVLRSGGALVARVPDGTRPMPLNFLQRNELLAAFCEATIVVEAGFKSGARHTASVARRYGRPLGVVPHPPWTERGAGCAVELAMGASPIIGPDDVVRLVGSTPALHRPRFKPGRTARRPPGAFAQQMTLPPDAKASRQAARSDATGAGSARPCEFSGSSTVLLDPVASAVVSALSESPIHIDEVCDSAGLSMGAASSALLTLTLEAVVVEGPAGYFRRVRRCPDREK